MLTAAAHEQHAPRHICSACDAVSTQRLSCDRAGLAQLEGSGQDRRGQTWPSGICGSTMRRCRDG